ncbi:MAG: FKBP-type peptidyl-prolyl cis-trans isomerase [Bacteroidaceae bacterium]|nr:FKBP-type peptidyl-prolyl cis-trans isomerase [Bacteroidaceae bacterium]
MKLRIILAVALVATAITVPAKVTKKVSKKAQKVVPVKVDTVSRADFSFDMGVAQVNGLKKYLSQRLNVDTLNNMQDFMRGLKESLSTPTDKKLAAYSAGLQIGAQVANQFLEQLNQQITGEQNKSFLDAEKYKNGFLAGITGEGLSISVDSATSVANTQMKFYKDQLMEQKYGANRKEGKDFLAENAKKPGVKTLPSGVQYKIIKEGTGAKPNANSTVTVNYEGRLIDGTVFDSSYKRNKPMTFKCNQVIKGWTDAIVQMPVGSTWEIYIPQELGYGNREAGQIKPFSTLIFKVELISIDAEKADAQNK